MEPKSIPSILPEDVAEIIKLFSPKEFAIETYTMPTHIDLYHDLDISNNIVISGFLEQLMEGTPAPTTRGMALVYDPLETAFENVYTGEMTSSEALLLANQALESDLEGI